MVWTLAIVVGPVVGALVLCGLIERRWPWRPAAPDITRPLHATALAMLTVTLLTVAAPLSHLAAAITVEQSGGGLMAPLPAWVAVPAGVLAIDAAEWTSHWLLHRVGPLWRVHRLHHEDERMDSATAFRFHPLEALLRYLMVLGVIVALGAPPAAVVIATAMIFAFNLWQHANVPMPAALRGLDRIIITPETHRAHHSVDPADHGSNYGLLFAIWDRLAGSYRSARGRDLRFGLGDGRAPTTSLPAMLTEPLRRRP